MANADRILDAFPTIDGNRVIAGDRLPTDPVAYEMPLPSNWRRPQHLIDAEGKAQHLVDAEGKGPKGNAQHLIDAEGKGKGFKYSWGVSEVPFGKGSPIGMR